MEAIDPNIAEIYGSLLDSRETPVAAIPAIYDPRSRKQERRSAALLVTDVRIVVGAEDLKNPGQVKSFGLRNRRLRLDVQAHEDHLRSRPLLDLRFEAEAADLLSAIDRDAAAWDQIDDTVLGVLIADERGDYYFSVDAGSVQRVRVNLDGHIPEDVIARCREIAADPELVLSEAEDVIVAEYLGLKNESWLDDGEAEVTEAEFRRRLSVLSLGVLATNHEIYFGDDDMFGGHSLVASHSQRRGWDTQLWG